jgi:hypothetical protein
MIRLTRRTATPLLTTFGARGRIRQVKIFLAGESFALAPASLDSDGARRALLDEDTIMQRVTLVRYVAKPDRADENEALSGKVFAELKAASPRGAAYALFREGSEFLHLFINLEADDSSPVTELSSFKAFSKDIDGRCETPPQATRFALTLVDSYGFDAALAPA